MNDSEKKGKIQLFFNESEINYNCSYNYAFMNWNFDDSLGYNDKNNPTQILFDNFKMGNAYIANAIIGLDCIIKNRKNYCVADTLIFPILFDIWHSIELWLKSSLKAIELITDCKEKNNNNHDIVFYLNQLKNRLTDLNMQNTIDAALPWVTIFVDEVSRVNAHFDFARYTFGNKGDYQFYNAPLNDKKQWQFLNQNVDDKRVPNTGVDLNALLQVVLKIVDSFRTFVEFLLNIISQNEILNDESYMYYLQCKNQLERDMKHENANDIIQLLFLYVL